MCQNPLKDPSVIVKPKIQSPKKNAQEFKGKVKKGIQPQRRMCIDHKKQVFVQAKRSPNHIVRDQEEPCKDQDKDENLGDKNQPILDSTIRG
ncbi:hypothetical protein HanPI659440_Chr14g0557661 [Helianthus annuus]|nr:hypothetical protein HanPI659440_Chr14g0557661 [Helianthus annuus]